MQRRHAEPFDSRLDIEEYVQNHISVASVLLVEVHVHIYAIYTGQTSTLNSELLLVHLAFVAVFFISILGCNQYVTPI